MRVMLLAAGKGERMRPLTLKTPKPLLRVGGRPLIARHLDRLSAAGVREVVINVSWLGEQITEFCGDGSDWGLNIQYSREEEPLETAGGLVQALRLLGSETFLVVNADVLTDYPLEELLHRQLKPRTGHLVLVSNPPQHSNGDFSLSGDRVTPRGDATYTFSGIALYHPTFFAECSEGKQPLLPLLLSAIDEGRLSGEHFVGTWHDVGTPERLADLDVQYAD
ncbi:MAG: N-acetylmuramate alpha-1-phosphate uridylyltransferase MurU [Pseudomonadota bacterium]